MFDKATAKVQYYEIRLRGHLEARWAKWFDGLIIALDDDGNTILSGLLADQSALYGLLKKVRDAGLTLLSVNTVEPDTRKSRER
jgi:hypothetical protein